MPETAAARQPIPIQVKGVSIMSIGTIARWGHNVLLAATALITLAVIVSLLK
jgi:hypothetical protein